MAQSDGRVTMQPVPDISDIPQSMQLHTQLDTLNQAIAALAAGGTVNYLTVHQAPPLAPEAPPDSGPPPPPVILMDVRVNLDPPIADAGTLADISQALQKQADAITKQLTDMGYSDNPPSVSPPPR